MSGTKAGGAKWRETMRKKYGDDGVSDFMSNIGAQGGKASTGMKGFAVSKHYPLDDKRNPSNAGRRGGQSGRMCKICRNIHGKNAPCI